MVRESNLSREAAQDTDTSSVIPPRSSEIQQGPWRRLLRPQLIEKAVFTTDVIIIVLASLFYSSAYRWITTGDLAHVTGSVVVGMVFAINFATIIAARWNYRFKNLTLFARQSREVIIIWTAVYGMLAVVAFTLKMSADFSRGTAILSYAGGLATLVFWRLLVARFISQSLA